MTLWALEHVRQDRDVLPALREALDLLGAMLDAPSGLYRGITAPSLDAVFANEP